MSNYKITLADYNTVQLHNSNLLVTTYGSTVASTQLYGSNITIGAQEWGKVYSDLNRSFIHQFGPSATFESHSPVTTGTIVLAVETGTYVTSLADMTNNYWRVDASQLTDSPVTVSITTSSSTLHAITYTWPTVADAQHFFNLGGTIQATQAFGNTAIFNYASYNSGLDYAYVAPTPDNNGVQTIFMVAVGNVVEVEIEVVPNISGHTVLNAGGVVHCYTSNALTGGIAAVTPVIQDNANTGQFGYTAFSTPKLSGNAQLTTYVTLTNSTLVILTATNFTFNADPRVNVLASPITAPIVIPNGVPGAPGTYKLPITLQNNSILGDRFLSNNSITINFDSRDYLTSFTIPFPVELDFGLLLFNGGGAGSINGYNVTGLHSGDTIYTSETYTFGVLGYGGVLNHITNISVSSGYSKGFNVSIVDAANGICELYLDTFWIPNGTYSATITVTAIDNAGNSATLSIPVSYTFSVTEYHLGEWLSPQNAWNGVMGFSYDYINGQRVLTMGFGMGGGNSYQLGDSNGANNGYNQYSQYALAQLKTIRAPGYFGTRIVSSGCADTTNTTRTKTYGVWYSDLTTTSFDETFQFLIRNNGTYRWDFSWAQLSNAQFYLNGSLVANESGTNPPFNQATYFTAGVYSVRLVGTAATGATSPALALSFTSNIPNPIGGYDVIWSTLQTMTPNWAEVGSVTISGDSAGQTFSIVPKLFHTRSLSYASAFTNNSIVTVTDITGNGDLHIDMNSVPNPPSSDAPTQLTVGNAMLLPYYYSLVENKQTFSAIGKDGTVYATINNVRYNNIGGDAQSTPMFTGFDRLGNVTTSIQPTPGSQQQGSSNGNDWLTKLIEDTILYYIGEIALGELGFATSGFFLYDLADAIGIPLPLTPVQLSDAVSYYTTEISNYISGLIDGASQASTYAAGLAASAEEISVAQSTVEAATRAWLNSIGTEYAPYYYEQYEAALVNVQNIKNTAQATYQALLADSKVVTSLNAPTGVVLNNPTLASVPANTSAGAGSLTQINETAENINAAAPIIQQTGADLGTAYESLNTLRGDIADKSVTGIVNDEVAAKAATGVLQDDLSAVVNAGPVESSVVSTVNVVIDQVTGEVTTEIIAGADTVATVAGSAAGAAALQAASGTAADTGFWATVVDYGTTVLEWADAVGCFTPNTLIDMADGTQKFIKDVKIGDLVWNYNNTQINKVTLIETRNSYPGQQLWSPDKNIKPFATNNHPLFINDKLSIPDPEAIYDIEPWFGKLAQAPEYYLADIDIPRVYNFYTTGDFTYRANGYGTTTMLFEPNASAIMLELDMITFEDIELHTDMFSDRALKYQDALYGGYLLNKWITKMDTKLVYRISSKVYKSPLAIKLSFYAAYLIGYVAHKLKTPYKKLK